MSTADGPPQAVVFDIGNVLVTWDPRLLYRKLLPDEEAVEWFLANICTPDWNAESDRGRGFPEAVERLSARHPEHAELIVAYWERWDEMVGGAIGGSVAILDELLSASVPCYGLTNFSPETWPRAVRRFPFLRRLQGVVVSGHERVVKPEPAIYRRLASRYGLRPAATVFIDDLQANVDGARIVGFRALRFESPAKLRDDLRAAGLPV